MLLYWMFAVSLLCANTVECTSQEVYSLAKLVTVCGTVLPRAVERLCSGAVQVQTPEDYEEYMRSKKGKRAALKYAHHLRKKRQIVDECCNKACTIAELMMYCPEDQPF